MKNAGKTYAREFSTAMIGYTIIVVVAITLIGKFPESPWRFGLALLPVVPILFGLRAFMRFLSRMDELQQRIQLAAIAFAAGTVGLLSLAYGFLEIVGLPHLPLIWIFPAMIMLWGLGLIVATRRYS